jgi:guanylate kinase
MYGTPNAELDRAFSEGKTPLLVIDLNGVKSLALHPKYSACNLYIYTDIDVIEKRLSDRYFVENPKPDSELNYNKRTAQNIKDWRDLSEYGRYIHAFVENNTTVAECCERVLDTFANYADGEECDEWRKNAIINGLTAIANERG